MKLGAVYGKLVLWHAGQRLLIRFRSSAVGHQSDIVLIETLLPQRVTELRSSHRRWVML
jgi:hypothetical protein